MSEGAILIPVKDEPPYIYDPPQVNITTLPTFPTRSGVTQVQATDKCTKAVKESLFGRACLKMYPNMEIKPIIDECVMDIKVGLLSNYRVTTKNEMKQFFSNSQSH